MKFFVIVMCLLCERFFTHASSVNRFNWFQQYNQAVVGYLSNTPAWLTLIGLLLPIVLLVGLIQYIVGSWLFGLFGLIIEIAVFYYCIGPANPFFPNLKVHKGQDKIETLGRYFEGVNIQLFAVLFWYVLLGIWGALFYRLLTLTEATTEVSTLSRKIQAVMDWIPVRLTALSYLLVGNFQAGITSYVTHFFSSPVHNAQFLEEAAINSLDTNQKDADILVAAERQVEHALILQLTILALGFIFIWV